MALNLVRNSRVFFTTNVNPSTGVVATAGFDATNTQEIQVLDGFTFSQNTNADTVTISEAGVAPVRGQRSFNTSLAPVDFSLSTYIRPANATTSITAEESVLWNALFSTNAISAGITLATTGASAAYTFSNTTKKGTIALTGLSSTTGLALGDYVTLSGLGGADSLVMNSAGKISALVPGVSMSVELANPKTGVSTPTAAGSIKAYKSAWAPVASTYSLVTSAGSNSNQLQKFGMIFIVDSVTYVVDNCAMNQVMIDFGLDAIATAAWTGQGTQLSQSATINAAALATASAKNTTAPFITNKLSTVSMSLVNALGGAAAGTNYAVALTGGSITINNNISYVTPANLGVVNLPATYYTGTRAITGTLNAYLKTGAGAQSTGQLLSDMLSAVSSAVEPMATISIAIGGAGNATKVVMDMPAVTFSIPSVDVQQVVSTAINFTAEGFTASSTANDNAFALDEVNDIAVRYYSA